MVIFGLSMAVNERRTGNSFFPELKHLHDVCLLVFEWLNVFVPLGIVTLIAPQVSRAGWELFLPLGFTIMRFGNILHFAVSAIFIGTLVGRSFGTWDLLLVGLLSILASFGTIGLSGAAGLSALSAVLRPFALSYELALPILIVVDPVISMLRAMINVAIVSAITALGAGRQVDKDAFLTPADAAVLAV